MRGFLATLALSSVLLTLQVTALPRPQVGGSADTSVGDNQTTTGPGAANPFPNAGQGTAPDDGSLVSTASNGQAPSSGQAASPDDGSAVSTPSNAPAAKQPNTAVASTPLTPDNSSADTSANANPASIAADANPSSPPGELTGQLLGMPSCKGIYYNAKWDTCDEATGTLTAKASPNGQRRDINSNTLIGRRNMRRQAMDDTNSFNQQVKNPSVLNGQAGIDDGAVPRKQSAPPTSEHQPFVRALTGRDALSTDMEKRQTEGKTPGNINFWNTPFEPVQSQSPNPKTKGKRQSVGAGHSNNGEHGPLMGEDQVVDGSRPYPPSHKDKIKRHPEDHNTNPNRLSSQSQRSVEDKRAQLNLDTSSSKHRNVVRVSGQGSTRRLKMKEQRQVNNGSSNQGSNPNDPTGYLAALGNAAIVGTVANPGGLPKAKHSRREAEESSFDSTVPHRDGNHVEVGPPGPGGARNVIINRRAMNLAEDPVVRPRQNNRGTVREDADRKLIVTRAERAESRDTMMKRSKVQENAEGKLVVTQSKRAETEAMARKRAEVSEDADGKLVVHNSKRHESEGAPEAPMPQRRESIVKKDDMTKYRHEIPKQEKWFQFGPDCEDGCDDSAHGAWWWGD